MAKVSSRAIDQTKSKHVSRLITALGSFKEFEPEMPKGTFGRGATVRIGSAVSFHSNDIDFEVVVPFDDDPEVNESELIIYNLSKTTIAQIKKKETISVQAGYKGDSGIIMSGYVDEVKTKYEGVDKVTRIKAIDGNGTNDRKVDNISYSEGTKASYILKNLLQKLNLPIAVFKPKRDHTYKDKVTVDGDIMEAIKKYAEVCGISTYINKGKIYARHLKEGDNINFQVSTETGLVEGIEEFEEEITAEEYTDIIKGYKLQMLLQHRITTAAIIQLKSLNVNGTFRVRRGKHIFNESEAITEVEVI